MAAQPISGSLAQAQSAIADRRLASAQAQARTTDFHPTPPTNTLAIMDYASKLVRRNPWIITTERWFANGKFIALPLNPEAIEFNIPIRVAHETTHAAKYIYVWRRRSTKSVTQSFTVNFSISSGNIVPAFDLSTAEKLRLAKTYTGAGVQPLPPTTDLAADSTRGNTVYQQNQSETSIKVNGLYDKVVPIGVQNLYALLGLAEEVESYQTESGGYAGNRVIVGLNTLVFPQLLLYGDITPEGISFSMSADNPAEFTVSFSLLVQASTPALGYDSWQGLVNTYKNSMFSREQTLAWMQAIINHNPSAGMSSNVGPDPTAG